ncbi:MAG: glycine cleavage T C-terminal barrel domain-containing protein [Actinomycetota bacterium]
MTGATLEFDAAAQAYLPEDVPADVHVAGAIAGAGSVEAIAQGRLAGLEAAAARWGARRRPADARDSPRSPGGRPPRLLPPESSTLGGKQFACTCMDVTVKELEKAVAEGFDSMELLKRYTTVSMGPCQGKACMLASQRLCARALGSSFERVGPTTSRPPWTPVELGTLAGARRTPWRATTIHDVHAGAGATFMWAGNWRRPHRYSTPEEEVAAVRTSVGVIDVSTLGKFRIRGPQAVELLERLYPNRFADLPVGRVRYGVMVNDEGVIIDDGAVCRVEEDEFYATVTTGNTAALERWITWWLADWRLDVQVLNVTAAFAALNLAGPRSRSALERVTAGAVDAEGFPYLACRRMDVAGVPALVLRIGFVGELGYEIHVPSLYGEHVWNAAMEAGADLGIVPFGLEAQRILRLEKQHILVGQDTDAESDPFGAGLGWMVKADKPDFLGKRSLVELEAAVPGDRLVGFTCDPSWVPPEGASVVHDGTWVGRVTSARRSATVGRTVGLAWVPAGWASDGTEFQIRFGSAGATARVATRPFYDPEGTKVRS